MGMMMCVCLLFSSHIGELLDSFPLGVCLDCPQDVGVVQQMFLCGCQSLDETCIFHLECFKVASELPIIPALQRAA